jgi:hypothetical protein
VTRIVIEVADPFDAFERDTLLEQVFVNVEQAAAGKILPNSYFCS